MSGTGIKIMRGRRNSFVIMMTGAFSYNKEFGMPDGIDFLTSVGMDKRLAVNVLEIISHYGGEFETEVPAKIQDVANLLSEKLTIEKEFYIEGTDITLEPGDRIKYLTE